MRSNGKGCGRRKRVVNIVGGAVMGLLAGLWIAKLARRFDLDVAVRIFEAGAFGGGAFDQTATNRCQLWFHQCGTLYARTQPLTALTLQRSAACLRQLVPEAFRHPLAFAIDRGESLGAAECFRLLRINFTPTPRRLLRSWFPMLHFPTDSKVYRVGDGTITLPLLTAGLMLRARRAGIQFVRERVESLNVQADRVTQIRLTGSRQVLIGQQDLVVLTCGARIRPLVGQAGITIKGLRLFQSHLVATDAFDLAAMFFVLGGSNCIPHEQIVGRRVNIFGSIGRTELPPETDNQPLRTDPAAVEAVVRDVEVELGLRIPPGWLAWPAVKTEIVHQGYGSQSHHAFRIPELANAYIAIPGKLTQAAACGKDLALKIVQELLTENVARPIWQQCGTDFGPSDSLQSGNPGSLRNWISQLAGGNPKTIPSRAENESGVGMKSSEKVPT